MDILEQFRMHRHIICIDLKSFFASVECADNGWDPFKKLMVVADASRGEGSIILAVSPALKEHGVPGRLRIFELPRHLKKDIDIVKPNMRKYVDASNKILNMYLRYFDVNDILVYSIDEVFIDITSYTKLYKKTPYQITAMLLSNLRKEFKLYAAAGIGPNMLMAKFALDIEAKHNSDFIATWNYEDIPNKLWPITKLTDVWGIGGGLSKRLDLLGIKSMGELANYDVKKLIKHFGIMGEEMYLHANGIDISRIQDQGKLSKRKGYSIGSTLMQDTPKDITRIKLLDLVSEIITRLRVDKKTTNLIHVHVRYAFKESQPSFSMQRKLSNHTLDYNTIKQAVLAIYDTNVLDINIRKIGISVSNIADFTGVQLDLFAQGKDALNADLDFAYDEINSKFGKNTIVKASHLQKDSSFLDRAKLIGGHNAE